jgi:hypothetical protein
MKPHFDAAFFMQIGNKKEGKDLLWAVDLAVYSESHSA